MARETKMCSPAEVKAERRNPGWVVQNLHKYGNSLVPDEVVNQFGLETTARMIAYAAKEPQDTYIVEKHENKTDGYVMYIARYADGRANKAAEAKSSKRR